MSETFVLLDYNPMDSDSLPGALSSGSLAEVVRDRELVKRMRPGSYKTWVVRVEKLGKLATVRPLDDDEIAAALAAPAKGEWR